MLKAQFLILYIFLHVSNGLSDRCANSSTSWPPSSFQNFLPFPLPHTFLLPGFLTERNTGSCSTVWRPRWRGLCPPTTQMCGHVTVGCSASTRIWTTSWAMDWRMSRSRSDLYHSPLRVYLFFVAFVWPPPPNTTLLDNQWGYWLGQYFQITHVIPLTLHLLKCYDNEDLSTEVNKCNPSYNQNVYNTEFSHLPTVHVDKNG